MARMGKPHPAPRILRVLVVASLFALVPTIESCSEGDGSMDGEVGVPLAWASMHSMAGYAAGTMPTFSGSPDHRVAIDVAVGLVVVGGLELTPVGGLAATGAAISFALFLLGMFVPFPFWILQFPYPRGMFFVHVGLWTTLATVAHRIWKGRKDARGSPARPPPPG